MTSRPVDTAVAEAFLEAASPTSLQVAVRVLDQVEQNLTAERRQQQMQLEQARYDRAQVPNDVGKPPEDVKHLCNRLTAN